MQRSKRSRRSIRNGLGAGSPDPVRRRHPWPKGLAGWVMRWIDKRPEYKSVVLKGVLGEFEKAAYAAVRDSETEGPRKVRGKVIPPTRRPIPATPERVYALAMESIRSNNGDVFSGLMLGAELDDAFQDVLLRAIDNEVRESYSFGTDRLDLDVKDGSITLRTKLIGEEITDDDTELPESTYERYIARVLRAWGDPSPYVYWQFDSAPAFWRSRGTARFSTYPVNATFPFDAAVAVLAIFGERLLRAEAAKALREALA
mgnify:CR=1 FL=1